jgi:uncharacterized protein
MKILARRRAFFLALSLSHLFFGCAAERIYYFPNKTLYADPDKLGIPAELVYYPSLSGAKLCALYIPTDQTPKGTVVYFHGNFANLSNHFLQALFLTRRGFDVLAFDYQGFGASEGRPSPNNTVEDGIASVRYAQSRMRAENGGVVVFAQSIGAAAASVVAAREPLVKAVVLESGFTTYRAITKHVMRRVWFAWPFAFFVPTMIVRHRFDPIADVDKIAPRPLLIIHGTADKTVPARMSKELFAKAKEPKELWLIEGADHLMCQRAAGKTYQDRIADFFADALKQ